MTFPERAQLLFLQIVAALAVVGVVVVAAVLAKAGYEIPAVLVSGLVSALVGKWFGEPIASVTLAQVGQMPPPMAAAVARRAIESLPPAQREQLQGAQVVLEGLSVPPPAETGAADGNGS